MKLLRHREKIATECTLIGNPILDIKALRIDAPIKKSLKRQFGCHQLKSCDYIRRHKKNLFFIEISDFHAQLENLKKNVNHDIASKIIKDEIRLKLSETLSLHYQIIKQCTIKDTNQNLKNKALLTVCKTNKSDVIIFANFERELSQRYCPTHFSTIKVIPYTQLTTIFKR